MDGRVDGFRDKIKVAISAGMTLGLLKGRVAQGARIAPGLMHRAEQAAVSGAKTTTPALRHMALGAGESARAAGKATAMAPVKAPLQARMAAGEALGARAFDQSRPLKIHDAFGNTHGYSPEYMKTVAGSSQIADPKKLLTTAPTRAVGGTAATAPGRPVPAAAGTAVAKRRPGMMPGGGMNRMQLGTAQTQISPFTHGGQ